MYYFAINRCSFSGATFSGGFSQEAIEKRFTVSSIDRLEKLDLSLCEFSNMDFEDFLKTVPEEEGVFIYADPPYYLKEGSKLYGNKGDLHHNFDHDRFVQCMDRITKVAWIISYNDCDYVRKKFAGYRIESVSWSYGMNPDKASSEVLIFGGTLRTPNTNG
jgi:DNA adenine methylase